MVGLKRFRFECAIHILLLLFFLLSVRISSLLFEMCTSRERDVNELNWTGGDRFEIPARSRKPFGHVIE